MASRHSVPSNNPRPVIKRDYTNTAFVGGARLQSGRLHGRSKHLVDYVLGNLEAVDYKSACSLAAMAKHFGMMPGTLRMTLRGPLDLELLSVKRDIVYPTPRLLQQVEPSLSADAAAIVVLVLSK